MYTNKRSNYKHRETKLIEGASNNNSNNSQNVKVALSFHLKKFKFSKITHTHTQINNEKERTRRLKDIENELIKRDKYKFSKEGQKSSKEEEYEEGTIFV